jgi:predicted metalloprotease with PDZ domain
VTFPEANLHYAHVEMRVPALGARSVDLSLPAWIPGSYMIREYARNVERVTVTPEGGGAPFEPPKRSKNRWRVRAGGAAFAASFRVYLCRRSVRESWVCAERATLNPVNFLPYVVGSEARPHDLEVVPLPGWNRVDCPLDPLPGAGAKFRARDYEELADAVVQAGSHPARAFAVDGIPHLVTFVGEGNADLDRLAGDCRRIVETCRDLFGGLPYPRYHFMLEGWSQATSGGLEHLAAPSS